MAFPMAVNIQHFPPLLLFSNLSGNPLSKRWLSCLAVENMNVESLFLLKCKVNASIID